MQKQTKLLLIQGKRIATYIGREQQQVLLSETDVTFQMVKTYSNITNTGLRIKQINGGYNVLE
jgi:hypothetical protein